MDWLGVIKWLFSGKNAAIAGVVVIPGWGAVILSTYVYAVTTREISGLSEAVVALQRNQIQERLEAAYAAICMNPGDPALLQRIRELRQEYERVTGSNYQPLDCSLLMKLR